jgi:nucleoside-diphosphate-sugar epimerase
VRVRALVRSFTGASRMSRFDVDIVCADLADAAAVRAAVHGADVVLHCAHETKVDPATGHLTLVDGTRNLCEAALAEGIRLVHLSTSGVYGQTRDGDLTEDTPWQPDPHPYTAAKRQTERLVLDYAARGLDATVLQPTIVYGPYCRPWTHGPVRDLKRGIVPLVDGGVGLCNAVYVDDVVDAIVLAATCSGVAGQTFIVSGAEPVTWRRFYEAFEEALGPESTQEVTAAQLERVLAEQARAEKAWFRLLTWLRDPTVFWAIAKSPPLGFITKLIKRALPAKRRERLVSKVVRSNPERTRTAGASTPQKELLIPNATLLGLYRSRTHMRIDKARRLLGYDPQFDFARGMKVTSDYLRWATLAPRVPLADQTGERHGRVGHG